MGHGDVVGHFEFHLPLGRVVVQYLVHLPMARAGRHDGHMVRAEEVLQADLFLVQPMALAKHADVVLLEQAALKKARLSCGSRHTARSTWPDSLASCRLVAPVSSSSFSVTIDTVFGVSSNSAVNFDEDGLNQLPRTCTLSRSVAFCSAGAASASAAWAGSVEKPAASVAVASMVARGAYLRVLM